MSKQTCKCCGKDEDETALCQFLDSHTSFFNKVFLNSNVCSICFSHSMNKLYDDIENGDVDEDAVFEFLSGKRFFKKPVLTKVWEPTEEEANEALDAEIEAYENQDEVDWEI